MQPTPELEGDSVDTRPPTRSGWQAWLTAVAGTAIALAVFAWMGRSIAAHWHELRPLLRSIPAWSLAWAALEYGLYSLAVSLCYFLSLRLAGARVGAAAAAGVYQASQLAKYLPGKVVYVAWQVALARRFRVSVGRGLLGFTVSQVVLASAAVLVASPLLGAALGPMTAALTIGGGLLVLALLVSGSWARALNAFQRRRGKPEIEAFAPGRTLQAVAAGAASWVFYGLFAVTTALALLPGLTTADAVRVGAASVAAWLVGFLSFVTPAGAGVREGVFVLLVRGVMPEPAAMALALFLRVLDTVFQVAISLVVLASSLRPAPEAPR